LKIRVDKMKGLVSVSSVCRCFNLKRNAFYKFNFRVEKKHVFEHQIIDIVKKRRKSLPRESDITDRKASKNHSLKVKKVDTRA
jgi:putative transposase